MEDTVNTAAVERDVFGSQEIAYECLADTERTENFQKAINQVVSSDHQVIEMGTGTGILAVFAAQAGAKHVDAFEISIPMAKIAEKNITDNGLQASITVVADDVTTMAATSKQYDVLIAEMITVALIEEQLVPAFNNVLKKGLLKPTALAIPCGQETFVELVNTDFEHFGVKMRTIQIEQTWQDSKLKQKLTAPQLISHVDFNAAIKQQQPINPVVDKDLTFTATEDGVVNAIRLTSNSILSSDVVSGWTQCMNSPAIIPIDELQLTKGQTVTLNVYYEMGGEMKTFKVTKK